MRRGLSGPLLLLRAVADSDLPPTSRLVAYAMINYAGFDTAEMWASVETLVSDTGLSVRSVRRGLRDLELAQAIACTHRSKGGRRRSGKGVTSHYRLLLKPIAAPPNPATVTGLSAPEPGHSDRVKGGEPGHTVHRTRPHSPNNPATVTGEHTTEQTKEQTTTQQQGRLGDGRDGAGADGGGCGGRSAVWDEWERKLVEAGVARGQAAELVRLPHVTDDQIGFAMWEARKKLPDHPGRFIAALVRKPPSELDGFEPYLKAQEQEREQAQIRLRCEAYEKLAENINRLATAEHAEQVMGMFNTINSVWPTREYLARSGALTDEELSSGRWWDLFNKLARAARDRSLVGPKRPETPA